MERKYMNFIYYKNFKDYEQKYYLELNVKAKSHYLENKAYYRIILAKYYLKLNYSIRLDEINDSIIYEKENKMYDDCEITDLLIYMRLICTINGIPYCTYNSP